MQVFEINLPVDCRLRLRTDGNDTTWLEVIECESTRHICNLLAFEHNPETGLIKAMRCDNLPQGIPFEMMSGTLIIETYK